MGLDIDLAFPCQRLEPVGDLEDDRQQVDQRVRPDMTALPRVSLNGNYQDARILPVLTSGAATAMWNGFRRIAAA